MARTCLLDYLPAFRFHLVDVAPLIPPTFPIFLPQAGFSSITAPEITVDMEEIPEGNAIIKRKVIKGATVSSITLSRGVTPIDSDFWRWFSLAILGPKPSMGKPRVRRNIMLIQFMHLSNKAAAGLATVGLAAAATGADPSYGGQVAASLAASAGITTAAGGIWRVPAKAWMLWDCLPSRWKSGTDFDATASEVSIAELDLEPELVEEFSLATALAGVVGA